MSIRIIAASFFVACAFLFALPAFAAYTSAYYNTGQTVSNCFNPKQPCMSSNMVITYYVPIERPGCESSMQGCNATSKPNLKGIAKPMTVDAVRLGLDQYVTCASDPSNYGKYFYIGPVTYRSYLDKQMHTLQNVVCYVHDTGGAFKGRPDKLDVAITICPECDDAAARKLAAGSSVGLLGAGVNIGNPFSNGAGIFGGSQNVGGNQYGSNPNGDNYCVKSIEPVIVVPLSPGISQQNCYNSIAGSNQQNPFAQLINRMMAPTPASPIASPPPSNSNPARGGTSATPVVGPTTPAPPAALIIAQPSVVDHGQPIIVSWTSVGMSSQQVCQVFQGGTLLADGNAGSKSIDTRQLSGTVAFTLKCKTVTGASYTHSTVADVN